MLIQKTQKLFLNFLKEVQLEAPCQHIRFGAIIQLIAPDMPCSPNFAELPMAVSMTINANAINSLQSINEQCDVTLGPVLKSCIRNAFIIKRYITLIKYVISN